jgi:hypothetical protein
MTKATARAKNTNRGCQPDNNSRSPALFLLCSIWPTSAKKFTTPMEEDIIKKLKKLAVDHKTDAGRMIEKLVEDD